MLLGVGPDGPVTGRRVAVTGLGAVTCCGLGTEALWDGLVNPTHRGRAPGARLRPGRWFGPKEARRLDRFAQFSVAAADMALADAGDLDADPGRSGVIFATGVGGLRHAGEQVLVFDERGPRRVSPLLVPMMMANAGAANISMRSGWHGPVRDRHHRLRRRDPRHGRGRPAGGHRPLRRGHRRRGRGRDAPGGAWPPSPT